MNKLDHSKVKTFYDKQYYRSINAPTKGLPWHMSSVAGRLGELRGKLVLDVACGTGQWLYELAARGAIPAGLDISENALEVARQILPEAELKESVAERIPFNDKKFDLVTCLGSLEHFIDQPEALSEMHRVCKPGAKVLILVPNSGFITRKLHLFGGTKQVAIRETVRSLEEWQGMLEEADFRILHRWRDLHIINWGMTFNIFRTF